MVTGTFGFELSADGKKILVDRGASPLDHENLFAVRGELEILVIKGGSASIHDASPGAKGQSVVTRGMT